MAIHRTFNTYKFTRTYLGGSKKIEKKLLYDVQDSDNDCINCNWVEFRKLFIPYFDDTLNVVFSWRKLMNIVRYALIGVSVLFIINVSIFGIIFGLSLISHLIYLRLNFIEKRKLFEYDFCMVIINDNVRQKTGLVLDKNW